MTTQNRKLTKRQIEALAKLAVQPGSSYGMSVSLGTLWALCNRSLIAPVGAGHVAFPHNGQWQITATGTAALAAATE